MISPHLHRTRGVGRRFTNLQKSLARATRRAPRRSFAAAAAATEVTKDDAASPKLFKKLQRGQLLNGHWASQVLAMLPGFVSRAEVSHGEVFFYTSPEKVKPLLRFLRDHTASQFKMLVDMSCVDNIGDEKRFEVWYMLESVTLNANCRVLVSVDELTPLPTVTDLWASADWAEREVYDMYGVFFNGHPNLRRILTDYGFKGHPLRKDFPVSGYTELRYDDTEQRIVHEPIEITQEFRNWKFVNPWHKQTIREQEENAKAAGRGDN